ncbi:MAG: hypothetical protein ABIS84_04465 [Arachnia sp.]
MLKLAAFIDLGDRTVDDNDARYEGGVPPTRHAASVMHDHGTGLATAPRCHRFEHTDRWADGDKKRIDANIRELIAMGYHGDTARDLGRSRTAIDFSNPATRALQRSMPTIAEWFKLIPRAVALDIIYEPDKGRLCNGVVLDDEAVSWFRNIDDAIGIRSRAAVLSELLRQEAAHRGSLSVASLACGAAQPVLETMAELLADGDSADSAVTLVDLDRESLAMAEELAGTYGIADHVTAAARNILGLDGIDVGDATTGGAGGYHVVEALGFLEYLPPENQESYTYNGVVDEKRSRAGAIVFLKNAYNLVRPGGLLIFGNMLDETHRQLEFTLNTVQWPHIQPRSITQMLRIIAAAGLDVSAEVDIYCPTDGVYAVYAIRKP